MLYFLYVINAFYHPNTATNNFDHNGHTNWPNFHDRANLNHPNQRRLSLALTF